MSRTIGPQRLWAGLLVLVLFSSACQSIKSDYKSGQRQFVGVNLRFSDLKNGHFDNSDFRGANMVWAKLDHARFRSCNMSRVNFRGASCYGADFRNSDLKGSIMTGANFKRANLKNADLRGLNLRTTKVDHANFDGCLLGQANLQGMDLSRTNVDKARLVIARYDEKTLWPPGFDPKAAGAVLVRQMP